MKKGLPILVILSLLVTGILCSVTTGSAYAADSDYGGAVNRLGILEIMVGDERGFRPDDPITRAEFAAVVVRALGLESAARFSDFPTQFQDVDHSYKWAWGYINLATGRGIIRGYDQNRFGPGDPITYEQVITMLVRALGYEPAVVGGYPAGYLAKGAELKLTDDADVYPGNYAPRKSVAVMVDNALDVNLMERTTFGDEKNYTVVNKTLLEDKLGVDITEGIITDVDDDELCIENARGKLNSYTVADYLKADQLEGVEVTAWVMDDEIIYLEEESNLIFDVIEEITYSDDYGKTKDNDDIERIKLDVMDKTYRMAEDFTITVNGSGNKSLKEGYFARIVLDGSKIKKVEAYDMQKTNCLVTDVDNDSFEYILGEDMDNKARLDDAESMVVVINGRLAEYEDLEEGMIVNLWEGEDDRYIIAASDEKVVGRINRVKSDEVRIGSKYYEYTGYSDLFLSTDDGEEYLVYSDELMDSFFGEKVTAYLDITGRAAYIRGEVDEKYDNILVYVIKTWETDYLYAKVFTEKGSISTYKLDEGELSSAQIQDVKKGEILEFEIDEDGFVVDIDAFEGEKFAFDKNSIEDLDDRHDIIKMENGEIYFVDRAAVFFDLSDDDEDEYEVLDWNDIEGKNNLGHLAGEMAVDEKNKVIYAAFKKGTKELGYDDEYIAMVLDKAKISRDYYELQLDTGDDEIELLFEETEADDVEKYYVLVYTLKSDGKGRVEAAAKANGAWDDLEALDPDRYEVVETVVASDGHIDDGFIRLDASWYRVSDYSIVYEVVYDDDVEYSEADLGDIDRNDEVKCFIDNGVVKVIVFVKG